MCGGKGIEKVFHFLIVQMNTHIFYNILITTREALKNLHILLHWQKFVILENEYDQSKMQNGLVCRLLALLAFTLIEITAPEKSLRNWCFLVNIFRNIIQYSLVDFFCVLFFLRDEWYKRLFIGIFISLSTIYDRAFCENSEKLKAID